MRFKAMRPGILLSHDRLPDMPWTAQVPLWAFVSALNDWRTGHQLIHDMRSKRCDPDVRDAQIHSKPIRIAETKYRKNWTRRRKRV